LWNKREGKKNKKQLMGGEELKFISTTTPVGESGHYKTPIGKGGLWPNIPGISCHGAMGREMKARPVEPGGKG